MRHPLWLVDSTCLVLFFASIMFVIFSQQKLPKRVKLEPTSGYATPKLEPATIDISQIYQNDLFNTYHKATTPLVQPDYTPTMPTPPMQSMPTIPAETRQPFLPPLNIKLRGVITLDDESNNSAMIADGQSNEQKNYKVGDLIQDARIIRILSNRIILIRSNGQQETLYLNERDIETDPAYTEARNNWIHVAKRISDDHYLLDPEAFAQIVRSMAQCIDIFDMTTVYEKGASIGCRIGNITHDSLPVALGLEPYDIITHIDSEPVLTTQERYAVYQKVIKKQFDDTLSVSLIRDNEKMTFTYKLIDLKDPLKGSLDELESTLTKTGILTGPTLEEIEQERIKLLQEKYKFAPTVQDIKIQQKMAMLKEGKQE